MDWKSIVQSVAPVIGTALGGPLAGTAIKALGAALLGDASAGEDKIKEAVLAGLDPTALAALKKQENDFKVSMRELDIQVEKMKIDQDESYLKDIQSAREHNAQSANIFYLGGTILSIFAVVLGLVLFGAFEILIGGLAIKDPSTSAAVFGLIGTVIGYVASNAQQVVGFYYGSSKGSQDKSEQLSSAIKSFGDRR